MTPVTGIMRACGVYASFRHLNYGSMSKEVFKVRARAYSSNNRKYMTNSYIGPSFEILKVNYEFSQYEAGVDKNVVY